MTLVVEFSNNSGRIGCACLLPARFFAVNEGKIYKVREKHDSHGKECERVVQKDWPTVFHDRQNIHPREAGIVIKI